MASPVSAVVPGVSAPSWRSMRPYARRSWSRWHRWRSMSATGRPCLPRLRDRSSPGAALGRTPPSPCGRSPHRCPVAMRQAFPTSDASGHSVARGRSSRRRARVPSVLHVSRATAAAHASPWLGSCSMDDRGAVSGGARCTPGSWPHGGDTRSPWVGVFPSGDGNARHPAVARAPGSCRSAPAACARASRCAGRRLSPLAFAFRSTRCPSSVPLSSAGWSPGFNTASHDAPVPYGRSRALGLTYLVTGLFPHSPLRTRRASFPATGSPPMGQPQSKD